MCENIENSLQSRSRVFKTLYRAIKKIGGRWGGAGVPNEVSGEYVVYMQDFS